MTSEAPEFLGSITVVLADANVLYSRVLRDYLVYAADEGAIAIRWSRAILSEVVEHLRANNSTFDAEQAALLIRLLNDAYPHAEVKPTAAARRKVNQLDMPDEMIFTSSRQLLALARTFSARTTSRTSRPKQWTMSVSSCSRLMPCCRGSRPCTRRRCSPRTEPRWRAWQE